MVTKPERGERDWDVTLNAALDDLQSQATTNASSITSQGTRIATLERSPAAADFSLEAWTYDPLIAAQTSTLTSGTVYMAKLRVVSAFTTSSVYLQVSTAGSSLTAGQNFIGLYDAAGTRVALTADQTTAWGSTGLKTAAWAASASLSAGFYYVALLTNGTTGITIARASAQGSEMLSPNLTAATYRWSTGGTGLTGLTALPATITMSNRGAGATSVWAALS